MRNTNLVIICCFFCHKLHIYTYDRHLTLPSVTPGPTGPQSAGARTTPAFWANVQHATCVAESPAYNLNPILIPKPNPTDPINRTLLTLTLFEHLATNFHR